MIENIFIGIVVFGVLFFVFYIMFLHDYLRGSIKIILPKIEYNLGEKITGRLEILIKKNFENRILKVKLFGFEEHYVDRSKYTIEVYTEEKILLKNKNFIPKQKYFLNFDFDLPNKILSRWENLISQKPELAQLKKEELIEKTIENMPENMKKIIPFSNNIIKTDWINKMDAKISDKTKWKIEVFLQKANANNILPDIQTYKKIKVLVF